MLREHSEPRAPACRAPRFSIDLPIRYRTPDAATWHEGRTENISCSGMLIRTRDLLPARTPIEMLIALPNEVGGRGVPVICRGRVVRTEAAPTDADQSPGMAATIIAVRYLHAQDADPRRI